jgi:WD40 repeat protein
MKKIMVLIVIAILFSLSLSSAQDTDTAWTRQTPGNDVRDVKFSPDGNTIATVHDNALIYFWETATGNTIKIMNKHLSGARAIAYSNDGNYLYSGGEGGKIFKFDTKTYDTVQTYLGNYPKLQSWIVSLCPSNDNTRIFAGTGLNDSNNIIVIDEKTGDILKTFSMSGVIGKLILSNDNRYIAVFSAYNHPIDQSIHYQLTLWDATTYQKIKTLDDTKDEIGDIAFSFDGTQLYEVQSYANIIKIWDTKSGNLIKNFKPKDLRGIYKLAIFKSNSQAFIIYSSTDNKGRYGIFDLNLDIIEYFYTYQPFTQNSFLSISADESRLASGGSNRLDVLNNKTTGLIGNNPKFTGTQDIIIPNPLTNQALIKFNLLSSGITILNLLNESGITIKSLFNSFLDAGNNELTVNLASIPSGNYLVSIQCKNYNKTLKLSIIK